MSDMSIEQIKKINEGGIEDYISHYGDDKEKLKKFRANLKKHLSNEYLILSEKKDELESDATQIRVEIERRDRTLFPSNEHGDARKYFSPLNLSELKESQKSDKEKELNQKLSDINREIDSLEERMNEIMDFLRDVDQLVAKTEKRRVTISADMRDNMDAVIDYYQKQDPPLEILLEYNSKRRYIEEKASEFIISQIMDHIDMLKKKYNVSMVLMEIADQKSADSSDDREFFTASISYDCEMVEKINGIKNVMVYDL